MLKQLFPSLFLLTTLATVPSAKAQTAEACGISYAILPGGSCLDLSYTSTLSGSRASLSEANTIYQRQYNANLELEILYNRYPSYLRETEEERKARYESLARTSIARDEIAESAQTVEDVLYPFHVQAMYMKGRSFSLATML